MTEKNKPPFFITNKMVELIADIMETLGKLNISNDLERLPKLRKTNRIKSIHSSLAIENNTLSIEDVTRVIEGKRVLGPNNEIKEVVNTFEAYKLIGNFNVFNSNDLLLLHGVLMNELIHDAGKFRTSQVGVFEGDKVIHMAPPAKFVPNLIEDLFQFLSNSTEHVLIKSCVFHYEFEFIHPFKDGNGRMGRLWQTAILANWKPIFAWIPVETIVKKSQSEYYDAISKSTSLGNSNPFIEFMLQAILVSIKDILIDSIEHSNHISSYVNKLLNVMEDYPLSALEIMDKLNIKSRISFRNTYLNPALEAGLIEMTIKDKPTSKNQRYFKR